MALLEYCSYQLFFAWIRNGSPFNHGQCESLTVCEQFSIYSLTSESIVLHYIKFECLRSMPVSCCQVAWLRKTASGGVMGGAHDRLLRCGPGPEAARITLAVPFLISRPPNKMNSHCGHHSLHSLIRD